MEWKFKKLNRDDTKSDPSHLEFFRSEALRSTVDALVREDIQNRLDARADGWPVHVKYRISEDGIGPEESRRWFPGLYKHLNSRAVLEELRENQFQHNSTVPYLVMEDFRTTGLRGDPELTEDPQLSGERNDFYWFIRNVGRSGKKSGDRGRWGLGKIVYPAASRIRSFFALSISENSGGPMLIGRSVLAIHPLKDGEYHSEGYFGEFPDPDHEYFAMPTQDPETIEDFRQAFGVERGNEENGLSLVIPFYDSESIDEKSLVRSLVEHYLWEILAGRLIAVVECGGGKHELRRETLRDFVMGWPGFPADDRTEFRKMVDFCAKADRMDLKDEGYYELSNEMAHSWNHIERKFASEVDAEAAQQRFREGTLLAFEVPLHIGNKKSGEETESSFMVYLQKEGGTKVIPETFVRDGLTIIEQSSLKETGVRALVVADDAAISEFLGDAENPAHTKWLETTRHFRGKYKNGPKILRFVKHSAAKLATWLGKIEDVELQDLLREVFSIEDEQEAPEAPAPGDKPGHGDDNPDVKAEPKKPVLQVSQTASGFSVRHHPEAERLPEVVRVRAAYDTIAGNPYSQWHPADFDFENAKGLQVKFEHCERIEADGNRMNIAVEGDGFSMSVEGFDSNRDLIVDARVIRYADEGGSDDSEV